MPRAFVTGLKGTMLSPDERARGVITASAGNHAQGVALAGQQLGCRAVIVMPESTPDIKVDAVKRRGGEVVLAGSSYDDAYAKALEDGFKQPVSFLHTREAIDHLNKVRDDFMQYKDLLRQKK